MQLDIDEGDTHSQRAAATIKIPCKVFYTFWPVLSYSQTLITLLKRILLNYSNAMTKSKECLKKTEKSITFDFQNRKTLTAVVNARIYS